MNSLRYQALDIWRAGVNAVDSSRLVKSVLSSDGTQLTVCGESFPISQIGRLVVVGAGKAGTGMAQAVEEVVFQSGSSVLSERLSGWINVPADCVQPLQCIHLHAGRPAGVNEPTTEGVAGALKILQLVERLRDSDLCLVLLSGGGSALLPAPCFGISLEEKQVVTRLLSRGGATIHELNTVRKQLSLIKGGGLGRVLKAGQMRVLIISDVIGDPLDIIASGPTVDDASTPQAALEILNRIVGDRALIPQSVIQHLEERCRSLLAARGIDTQRVRNYVIGNNQVAVDAAASRARELGYEVSLLGAGQGGVAAEVGRELAHSALIARQRSRESGRPICLISGGEPIVKLAATDKPRRGGRNQELVLAAAESLQNQSSGIVVVSGGTDGEDGPTDAAGAFFDDEVAAEMQRLDLQIPDYLAINNSYEFFHRVGGLLKTGPTHTNVMDLRVVVAHGE